MCPRGRSEPCCRQSPPVPVFAQVEVARATLTTRTVVEGRIHGHEVAHSHVVHPSSDCYHLAAEFMSGNDRVACWTELASDEMNVSSQMPHASTFTTASPTRGVGSSICVSDIRFLDHDGFQLTAPLDRQPIMCVSRTRPHMKHEGRWRRATLIHAESSA